MIYGLKTVLRIIYILDQNRQVPSISEPVNWNFPNNRELRRSIRTKATNTGLGIAGIDKFSLTNIIFLNLITFGHSIALIVLGEIICWSLLKIRINAGPDKVHSIQLVCFCSVSCERNSVWFFCYWGFLDDIGLGSLFYQTIISFNVSLLFCKISFKTLD